VVVTAFFAVQKGQLRRICKAFRQRSGPADGSGVGFLGFFLIDNSGLDHSRSYIFSTHVYSIMMNTLSDQNFEKMCQTIIMNF
jgi:hypothetical protein